MGATLPHRFNDRLMVDLSVRHVVEDGSEVDVAGALEHDVRQGGAAVDVEEELVGVVPAPFKGAEVNTGLFGLPGLISLAVGHAKPAADGEVFEVRQRVELPA